MPNLQCGPTTGITTQQATLKGTADSIPTNHYLRIAYSTISGGPYSSSSSNFPGTNTVGQTVSYNAQVTSTASTGATYFYVLQEIDSDGTTVLGSSSECTFTTAPYNPTCQVIASDDTTTTIVVCADW